LEFQMKVRRTSLCLDSNAWQNWPL
jgi:hypothetical protein